jgi:predicted nucleotidyltransferase
LDLLGEITGGGDYDALLPYTEEMDIFGVKCRCLGLERLIEVKAAVGRPKDFEPLAELRALLQERAKKRQT